ncbi:TrbM/KikA/MpfK family conjugal transfer protein [Xenorhabdus sp. KK7.4]|uniref:TrbM/KikA/MpfK family conjugal transfer protein n=1 Tax=Xenorhabdus sp. KK7.4 TaxID=1851572 RepID=UPI000C0577E0|nr:TrbM/KikA/MpfK family conjugal transfer protein [Xenorhabdus sp. KK7.4]PHM51264.1 trbM family protein [Xenorhabdus sp. KK7.4]
MKIKLLIFSLIGVGFSFKSQANIEFTGDTKLACEAILCLSTNTRPSECSPAIRKFFSIKAKKPWKTIQLRKNFLNLCPVSDGEGMPEYNDLLANNAEKCSSKRLNRDLIESKEERVCRRSGQDYDCHTVTYYRISNKLPNYCQAYIDHEYTDLSLRFVGESEWIKSDGYSNRYLEDKFKGKWIE